MLAPRRGSARSATDASLVQAETALFIVTCLRHMPVTSYARQPCNRTGAQQQHAERVQAFEVEVTRDARRRKILRTYCVRRC